MGHVIMHGVAHSHIILRSVVSIGNTSLKLDTPQRPYEFTLGSVRERDNWFTLLRKVSVMV